MSDFHAPAPGRLFVFGMGYSARHLAATLLAAGWRVAGTTRSPEKAAELRAMGVEPFLFDRDQPLADAAAALAGTTHLLASVPPDGAGEPVLDAHGTDIAALSGLAWAGYLSTTGVYGDTGGTWVTEDAPLKATGTRGLRRVAAEQGWLDLFQNQGMPVHIFRLPGIYGPGRSAIDALRQGTARRIDKPGHRFGRIHVVDIAGALMASMARPYPGRVYNVVDDEPAESAAVVAHAADLLGVPPPPLQAFDPQALGPMAASFYADNRLVTNDRLKAELGYRLTYPSFRDGLAAQLVAERQG
ncbi:SDR family oxidoreductase [Niveispirillum irakense]|uniref:SDR family oxidoreductase n=1 Tax=Niveispirillum irakense TaxID=34011 RepID=UPI0004245F58|nr:SDR family oxidoreductase [Niveispirillum irakense]